MTFVLKPNIGLHNKNLNKLQNPGKVFSILPFITFIFRLYIKINLSSLILDNTLKTNF